MLRADLNRRSNIYYKFDHLPTDNDIIPNNHPSRLDRNSMSVQPLIEPFHSHHSSTQMRELALVAHNNMKPAMHDFIVQWGEVLRKFRVTGTETTMSICKREWKDKEGGRKFVSRCDNKEDFDWTSHSLTKPSTPLSDRLWRDQHKRSPWRRRRDILVTCSRRRWSW